MWPVSGIIEVADTCDWTELASEGSAEGRWWNGGADGVGKTGWAAMIPWRCSGGGNGCYWAFATFGAVKSDACTAEAVSAAIRCWAASE